MRIGIYAGCFDPLHNGHMWVIEEGLRLFDKLYVIIGPNPGKTCTFSEDDRLKMIRESVNSPKVHVALLAGRNILDHARVIAFQENLSEADVFLLRGIRDADDFDYEEGIHSALQKSSGDIHFTYVLPPEKLLHLSSSSIKSRWTWQGDVAYSVPAPVLERLKSNWLTLPEEISSIFEQTTAGFAPAPLRCSKSISHHHIKMQDLPKTNIVYFGKMRNFFDKMVDNGFLQYPKYVTADQVRKMLDASPFDLNLSEVFHLRSIPIDSVQPTGERYLPYSESLGPIIVDANKALVNIELVRDSGLPFVIEGKHRWLDAKERGDETIVAWVGQNALEELGL